MIEHGKPDADAIEGQIEALTCPNSIDLILINILNWLLRGSSSTYGLISSLPASEGLRSRSEITKVRHPHHKEIELRSQAFPVYTSLTVR
jgi:hypothetical protein